MGTELFIASQLLKGVGPIDAAARKMAVQMGTDDPREVFRRIASGAWVVSEINLVNVPPWYTVKLGTKKTPDEYREALNSAHMCVDAWGSEILNSIICSQTEIDLDLDIICPRNFGFVYGTKLRVFIKSVLSDGVHILCPAEVGPALRLQYGNQPSKEWICIVMEAVTICNNNFALLAVGNNGELCLRGFHGDPETFLEANDQFAFARRK